MIFHFSLIKTAMGKDRLLYPMICYTDEGCRKGEVCQGNFAPLGKICIPALDNSKTQKEGE